MYVAEVFRQHWDVANKFFYNIWKVSSYSYLQRCSGPPYILQVALCANHRVNNKFAIAIYMTFNLTYTSIATGTDIIRYLSNAVHCLCPQGKKPFVLSQVGCIVLVPMNRLGEIIFPKVGVRLDTKRTWPITFYLLPTRLVSVFVQS